MTRTVSVRRASVLKAMAHPTRLMILDLLAEGERCVCELHAVVGSDLTTVSKHLSVLRAAGLVEDERRGQQVFYRTLVPCLNGFLACVDGVLERRPRAAFELARSERR
ncbi:MAG: metalloregulator ArsR/SmtB family transcription factor [Fimbriimonadales bacterium]|nr:metalloregulator ArsR/SmtB family transcription factor [Fimbriimonadales bacterium]